VHESVDECHRARGVREDFGPLGKGQRSTKSLRWRSQSGRYLISSKTTTRRMFELPAVEHSTPPGDQARRRLRPIAASITMPSKRCGRSPAGTGVGQPSLTVSTGQTLW
jgi:hypothetical protein